MVLVLGFIIRIGFFLSIQPWKEEVVNNSIIVSDAIGYDELAKSIMHTFSFEGEFSTYRTPLYPLFLALLYSISAESVWFVLLVQILLSLVSIYLAYRIGTHIFSTQAGLLAAFLFATDIHQAFFTVTLLTDTLFICLFLISIYCFCKSLGETNFKWFCLSAIALGTATLVRPISFLIPAILVFFIIVFSRLESGRKIIYSLVFSLIFISVLSPWLLHNYFKHGTAQLTTIPGYNLYYWNAVYVEAYKTNRTFEDVVVEFDSIAARNGVDLSGYSFQNEAILSVLGKDYIKDNFLLYWRRHFMGMINMYVSIGTKQLADALHIRTNSARVEPFAESSVPGLMVKFFKIKSPGEITLAVYLIFFLGFNYLFAFYGIYHSIKSKEIFVYLFIMIILYFSFLTGVVGWVRYRLPVMPIINILCGVGMMYFYDKRKTSKYMTQLFR